MPSFPLPNTAYVFRPLKVTDPPLAGWDVYALQTALSMKNADGSYGSKTENEVLEFQERRFMDEEEHDGIAGIGTQRKIMSVRCKKSGASWSLPPGCPYGHCEKECGGQLGNHTARYSNGSWDLGMCQRNTEWATPEDAFDCLDSLHVLCKQITDKWEQYENKRVVDRRRAFELACGSWNRPAHTDILAAGGTLTPSSSAWIEAYIDRVTSYVHLEDL